MAAVGDDGGLCAFGVVVQEIDPHLWDRRWGLGLYY